MQVEPRNKMNAFYPHLREPWPGRQQMKMPRPGKKLIQEDEDGFQIFREGGFVKKVSPGIR